MLAAHFMAYTLDTVLDIKPGGARKQLIYSFLCNKIK